MLLTEEQNLIKQSAYEFSQNNLKPNSESWSKNHTFPIDALKQLGNLGFMGMLVPEDFGGSNIGNVAYASVIEEIAAADGSCSTIVSVHNSVGCLPILKFGNDNQKQKYLPKLASGEYLGAFCLTEPHAGSDAANLKTKAVIDGDNFILNGTKQFITAGKHADIAIVFAVTDASLGKKGISAFIVPTNTSGYKVTKLEEKMGQEAAETAQVTFEDMKISKENLLGNLGEGYKIALSNLESGRIGIAAQSIGMAQHAFEEAVKYAKERESFSKPLIEHQYISFQLAEMKTLISAARQLTWHAATLKDNNKKCLSEAAQAKYYASEIAEKVCRDAIQIFGGYGYLQDFPVERIYRDVRAASIYEGTNEIQKMIIAKEL